MLRDLSYEEMLEIAGAGSEVLALRAIECAAAHNIIVHIRCSFTLQTGTLVRKENLSMEQPRVSAIAYDASSIKFTIANLPYHPTAIARILRALAKRQVAVDLILQTATDNGCSDIALVTSGTEKEKTIDAVRSAAEEVGAAEVILNNDMTRLSVVGVGVRSDSMILTMMLEGLASEGIEFDMLSISPMSITCLVATERMETAVQRLCQVFKLDSPIQLLGCRR